MDPNSQKIDLAALEVLLREPTTKMVPPYMMERLLAKGWVERCVSGLTVTSRGHAALLAESTERA